MESSDQSNSVPSSDQNPGPTPNMTNSPAAKDLLARANKEEAAAPVSAQTFTPGSTPIDPRNQSPNTTRPKSKTGLLTVLVVILLLLLAGGAAGYYYYFKYLPKMALVSYVHKLDSAKSAQFKMVIASQTASTTSQAQPTTSISSLKSLSSDLNMSLDGSYSLVEKGNPKLDTKLTFKNKLTNNQVVNGQLTLVDKTINLKFDSVPQFLTTLGLSLGTDWYKLDIGTSLSQTKCLFNKSANVGVVGSLIPLNLPVRNTKRLGNGSINMIATKHYSGDLDLAKLGEAITDANKDLSADCKLNLKPERFSNNTIHYELWQSSDLDRVIMTRINTSTHQTQSIELTSQAYNKDMHITAPSSAKDLKPLLVGLLSSQSSNSPTNARVASLVANQFSKVAAAYQKQMPSLTQSQLSLFGKAYQQQFSDIVSSLETWKKTTSKYPNPNVDWQSSAAGATAKGSFGVSAIKENYKDPITSKTYAFGMVTSSALPSCHAASDIQTTATLYYQSLTKTTYTMRLCTQAGLPIDISNQ